MRDLLPMATTSSKHFMEGELSVEVLLYDVQPFSFSLLSLQLLQLQKKVLEIFSATQEVISKLSNKVDQTAKACMKPHL